MNKEEYGELLKYLGILKFVIYQLRNQEREFDIKKDILQAINLIINEIPLLEEYFKN